MVSSTATYNEDGSLKIQKVHNNIPSQDDSQVVVPVGFTTPCPFPSFPPNLAFNKLPAPCPTTLSANNDSKDMQDKIKGAPALPDMSDDCTSSSFSLRPFPSFKIQPRFATLSTTTVEATPPMMRMMMSHHPDNNGDSTSSTAMMEILSSDDEEEEESAHEEDDDATSSLTQSTSFASSSFDTEDEDESLATLSSMETTRQERLDAIMRSTATNKVSPHKKTMHLKHPMPQRPGAVLQQQPRRHSLSAIAA